MVVVAMCGLRVVNSWGSLKFISENLTSQTGTQDVRTIYST